ncbi:MAG: ATP-binding protein [Clostridiaceae bacterium]|nr:ATP-binding protein [Clostridiaceae bacterium]
MNKWILRKEYLQILKDFRDKDIIKIVTGIRRCGKSTLMEMFQEYLCENGIDKNHIISVNFEDYNYVDLLEPKILHTYVQDKMIDNKMYYVFFDEIQNVKDFPRVVDSLNLKKNVDLYLTGSNAYMLSSEIATLLSGRYIEVKMLPLSFKEYVEFTGDRKELGKKYLNYLKYSSFPYATMLDENEDRISEYLQGIYSTVVLKDIISRNKISDVMMLDSVIRFIFSNIGNLMSTKKISDTMTSDGRKIDVKTVEKYISALMESFIVYQTKRYDIKGRNYLKTLDKYYVVDIGLRYMILGTKNAGIGHILENVIYLELIRRGYKVYVGKVENEEVDFVAINSKGTIYYQVSASVRDDATLARELKPLQKITDHYPKYILTLDEDPEADYSGIKKINALDFLLSD